MDYNRSTTDLSAIVITADSFVAGASIPFRTAAQNNALGAVSGVSLGIGTYVFPIGSPSGDSETPAQASILGVHLAWAATLAGVLTIELCNFPGTFEKFGRGGVDVSDFDTDPRNWVPWAPTSNNFIQVTGTNNTVSNCAITAGGTNVGAAWIDFALIGIRGARRARIKAITTVGGITRVNPCGKLGS